MFHRFFQQIGKRFVPVLVLFVLFLANGPLKVAAYTPADSVGIMKSLDEARTLIYSDPDSCFVVAGNIAARSAKVGFIYGMASAMHMQAFILSAVRGDDTSIYVYKEVLRICREKGYKNLEVSTTNNLAGAYTDLGQQDKALQTYQLALKLADATKDTLTTVGIYSNLGMLMRDIGDFKQCEKYFKQALAICEQYRLKMETAILMNNLGNALSNDKRPGEALPYLFAARRLGDSLKLAQLMAPLNNTLGDCHKRMGNADSALYYFDVAMKYAIEANDKKRQADVLKGKGLVYYDQKKYEQAEPLLARSYAIGSAINYLEQLPEICGWLANTYGKLGKFEKAYDIRTRESLMNDSLHTLDKVKAIRDVSLKYETKQVADKNAALEKETALQKLRLQRKDMMLYGGAALVLLALITGILVMRNNRLRTNQKLADLEQKQLLAQINPHFIFNCLNSVQQFVVRNDIENANRYLADFALLMRHTLDNSKESTTPLYKEIEYLENYLSLEAMRFAGRFSYSVVCEVGVDADEVEIPSMIVQPFVENAINHGLANLEDRDGVLRISFYKDGRHLICDVDDNGIGIEHAERLREQSFLKHTSRGMEMTRQRLALVSRLNGEEYEMTVINKKDDEGRPSGTIIRLKFPLRT